ncbi:galactokinase [Streptomyces qinzhouensis]|uniref:Galactokinase n=1 Tax=Streptomyces qinzhouensis TaxID=2599401 RepID=A0A5B8J7H8_9ACTN|nr:galactokinase [Streptomyces qinzhouensis]QDY77176.1 galactokinase [Streptomyces qinzhouensis]
MTGAVTGTGVWSAPGRVNLIGEHTDYNDGLVLPFALPRSVTVTGRLRDDGVLRLVSAAVPGPPVEISVAGLAPGAGAGGWASYPAGVLWALREAGHPVGGAELRYESTVPAGAGLSSSAALEVATALALTELYGLRELAADRPEIARLCRRAENVYTGVPTGIMDQTVSACGRAGHALLLDTRDLSRRHIPFDPAARGLALLVVDTRVRHAHADGEYGRRRAGCEEAAARLGLPALRDIPYDGLDRALGRLPDAPARALVRHVVTENRRVERAAALLTAGELPALGPLLTEGHNSLRDDFAVSCPETDLAVSTAVAAGALGARMTGGGFGGSVIVLLESAAVAPVTAAVAGAFAAAGHKPPGTFTTTAAAGAGRLS